MRILWVEDILTDCAYVSSSKEAYSWEQKSTYSQAKEEIKSHLDKYDVVLLDINLDGRKDPNSDKIAREYLIGVPSENESEFNLKPDMFLKEAGFHLYIQLLENGFPRDRIAFLSANISSIDNNQQTYNEFESKFKEARISPPIGFDKSKLSDSGKRSLNRSPFFKEETQGNKLDVWLKNIEGIDYIKLRRGIIDACSILKSDEKFINFSFLSNGDIKNVEKAQNNEIAKQLAPLQARFREPLKQKITDHLEELSTILPLREPKNKSYLLKRLARAIVFRWEGYQPSGDKSASYSKLGFVLRAARNFLSHGDLTIEEKDVAFLLILHFRGIFKSLSSQYYSVEKKILTLFGEPTDFEFKKLDSFVEKTFTDQKITYNAIECTEPLCLKVFYVDEKKQVYYHFIEFCEKIVLHYNHDQDDEIRKIFLESKFTLLYQAYFHSFCYIRKGEECFLKSEKKIKGDDLLLAKSFYVSAWGTNETPSE